MPKYWVIPCDISFISDFSNLSLPPIFLVSFAKDLSIFWYFHKYQLLILLLFYIVFTFSIICAFFLSFFFFFALCLVFSSFLQWKARFSSVQFSCLVVPDSLRPHESQHARPPCPSPTPGVHSDSCPSSQWCHPTISSSVVPFSSCPQSLSASESFPMSQLFTWGGQSTGVSALASFLPKNWLQIFCYQAFTAVSLPLNTALAALKKVWYVMFSFSFIW